MMSDDRLPPSESHSSSASENDALLAGYALGDLDSAEREQLAALLAKDPALHARLDEFRTTLQLLPLALPTTEGPPQRLRKQLLESSHGAAVKPGNPFPKRERLVPLLLGLVLLVFGLQLHQTREQLARINRRLMSVGTINTLTALKAAPRQLHLVAMAEGMPASGDVLVTGNGSHNVLMLNQLPPPPSGHVYRLWANVDGRRVGCVSFLPTEQGHVGMLIPTTPTSLASSLSVSIEPDPRGSAPKGPTVLITEI